VADSIAEYNRELIRCDTHVIRSEYSNFVGLTHSFIVFRATVVQKLSNPRAFPKQDGLTFVTVSAVYIHIVENLFRNFLRLVHCNVINIGVSNCQLKLYCLWGFSGKKLP